MVRMGHRKRGLLEINAAWFRSIRLIPLTVAFFSIQIAGMSQMQVMYPLFSRKKQSGSVRSRCVTKSTLIPCEDISSVHRFHRLVLVRGLHSGGVRRGRAQLSRRRRDIVGAHRFEMLLSRSLDFRTQSSTVFIIFWRRETRAVIVMCSPGV